MSSAVGAKLPMTPGWIGWAWLLWFALVLKGCGHATGSAAGSAAPARSVRGAPVLTSPGQRRLTIIHTNDLHSHLDPVAPVASSGEPSLGGLARRKFLVDQIRRERGDDNVLLVDAGDFSHGTYLYNAWLGSSDVMGLNALRYDAVTLGNHEFDSGAEALAAALSGAPRSLLGRTYPTERIGMPVVVSNLHVARGDRLRALIRPRVVLSRAGTRVGVVGVISEKLDRISNGGRAVRTADYVESVQTQVDLLTAEGVDIIVLLSHCGTAVDLQSAHQLQGVDVIVAGHDHALFGDPVAIRALGLPFQATRVTRPYPVRVTGRDGRPVLVVSAREWGRWLGVLDVTFDASGALVEGAWAGQAVPVLPGAQDEALQGRVEAYRRPAQALAQHVVGTMSAPLSRKGLPRSPLGAFIADAMLEEGAMFGATIALADGKIDGDLASGPLTVDGVHRAYRRITPIVVMSLTGAELEAAIENGLWYARRKKAPPLQAAGLEVHVTDPPDAAGPAVVRLTVDGAPVLPQQTFRVAVPGAFARGGRGYSMLKAACERGGDSCVDTGVDVIGAIMNAVARMPASRENINPLGSLQP